MFGRLILLACLIIFIVLLIRILIADSRKKDAENKTLFEELTNKSQTLNEQWLAFINDIHNGKTYRTLEEYSLQKDFVTIINNLLITRDDLRAIPQTKIDRVTLKQKLLSLHSQLEVLDALSTNFIYNELKEKPARTSRSASPSLTATFLKYYTYFKALTNNMKETR